MIRAQPLDRRIRRVWRRRSGRSVMRDSRFSQVEERFWAVAGTRGGASRRRRSCREEVDLRDARRGASGSESRRGDRRDRDGSGAGLRRRDRGGRPPPRRRRREPRSLRPDPGRRSHRRQVERAGRADPGRRHDRRIQDGGALAEVARTGAPARMATDDPGVPAELHGRLIALGVTSLVAAPIVVSGDIWGAVVVSLTRRAAVPGERRGATRPVRRPRRSRARERPGPGGARNPGRRAGRAQPRRGRCRHGAA